MILPVLSLIGLEPFLETTHVLPVSQDFYTFQPAACTVGESILRALSSKSVYS